MAAVAIRGTAPVGLVAAEGTAIPGRGTGQGIRLLLALRGDRAWLVVAAEGR